LLQVAAATTATAVVVVDATAAVASAVVVAIIIVVVVDDVNSVGAWLIDETLLHTGFHTLLILTTILFIQLCGG